MPAGIGVQCWFSKRGLSELGLCQRVPQGPLHPWWTESTACVHGLRKVSQQRRREVKEDKEVAMELPASSRRG